MGSLGKGLTSVNETRWAYYAYYTSTLLQWGK